MHEIKPFSHASTSLCYHLFLLLYDELKPDLFTCHQRCLTNSRFSQSEIYTDWNSSSNPSPIKARMAFSVLAPINDSLLSNSTPATWQSVSDNWWRNCEKKMFSVRCYWTANLVLFFCPFTGRFSICLCGHFIESIPVFHIRWPLAWFICSKTE